MAGLLPLNQPFNFDCFKPKFLKANSVDPDQTALMCRLIWTYTVHPHSKGVSIEYNKILQFTAKKFLLESNFNLQCKKVFLGVLLK
jgi:hypothetical protein